MSTMSTMLRSGRPARIRRSTRSRTAYLAAARLNELCQDTVRCTVTNELFSTDEEQIASLDPLPCPITIVWSVKDSLLPVAIYGKIARERVPQATFTILPDVNHMPMIDDLDLVG